VTALRVGVSHCLLGDPLRYDGQGRRSSFVVDKLGRIATLIPICPEVELGMSVPREPVRLEGSLKAPRMIAPGSGTDWTDSMNRFAQRRIGSPDLSELHGFVFTAKSPSCGAMRVKLYGPEGGPPRRQGIGLFAAAFMARFPLVPIAEDRQLAEPTAQAQFVLRLRAQQRLSKLWKTASERACLEEFHSRERALLELQSTRLLAQLDELLEEPGELTPQLQRRYAELYGAALTQPGEA